MSSPFPSESSPAALPTAVTRSPSCRSYLNPASATVLNDNLIKLEKVGIQKSVLPSSPLRHPLRSPRLPHNRHARSFYWSFPSEAGAALTTNKSTLEKVVEGLRAERDVERARRDDEAAAREETVRPLSPFFAFYFRWDEGGRAGMCFPFWQLTGGEDGAVGGVRCGDGGAEVVGRGEYQVCRVRPGAVHEEE